MTTKTRSVSAYNFGKLPAAGAFQVGPEVPTGWARTGVLYVRQVQHNVAGFVRFYVETSSDDEDTATPVWGFLMLVSPTITVVAATGFAQSTDVWLRDCPARDGTYQYPLGDLSAVRRLRVSIAEAGFTGDACDVGASVYLAEGDR